MIELAPLLLLLLTDAETDPGGAAIRIEGRSFWGLADARPFRILYSAGAWSWSEGEGSGTEADARAAILVVLERIGAWDVLRIAALDDSGRMTLADMLSDGAVDDAYRGDLLVDELNAAWHWIVRLEGGGERSGAATARAAATFAALDAWAKLGAYETSAPA